MKLNEEFTFGKHWCLNNIEDFTLDDEARRYFHIWQQLRPKQEYWDEYDDMRGTEADIY